MIKGRPGGPGAAGRVYGAVASIAGFSQENRGSNGQGDEHKEKDGPWRVPPEKLIYPHHMQLLKEG